MKKDYSEVEKTIVEWLADKIQGAGKETLVIGVSGGIDSAVVSTLCAKTGMRTVLLEMPINSGRNELAIKHIEWLKENYKNVESYVIDLTQDAGSVGSPRNTSVYTGFIHCINKSLGVGELFGGKEEPNMDLACANTQSRLRMVSLYYTATLFNGLVIGTGNKIEDFLIFYCTKHGDFASDLSPIGDLLKSEVRELGKHMGVSLDIVNAVPTDGLWSDGRGDEEYLGASYDEIEEALCVLEDLKIKIANGEEYSLDEVWYKTNEVWAISYIKHQYSLTDRHLEVINIVIDRHSKGKHKMKMPPICKL